LGNADVRVLPQRKETPESRPVTLLINTDEPNFFKTPCLLF
jgi:hypothetical protein